MGVGLGNPGGDAPFRRCDILDGPGLTRVFQEYQPQAAIHLAARTDLDEKRDISGYSANTTGVENLVAAIAATPSMKRCIFTSTQLVCRIGYIPKDDEDYQPGTLYGQSKVLGEQAVRRTDGGGVEWCIVRPTTVWGPGMNPHYQRFFRLITKGLYFHVGHRPLYKSYGYVGNVAHQYLKLLEAPAQKLHRKTLYLADYQPLSLRDWADALQREMGARTIRTIPGPLAGFAARTGDIINALGMRRFPFNSFRLNNILTEYELDLSETEELCGPLPFDVEQGIKETVAWLRAESIVS